MLKIMDPIKLTKELISFETITPNDAGSLPFMEDLLKSIGFSVIIKKFEDIDSSSKATYNLYAYTHKAPKKNMTFLGHLDVVHPGHDSDWTYPPFEPTIENGLFYGRGMCDMKATIACFCSASCNVIANLQKDYGLSMLLTYDEEGNAINGTKKMLHFLKNDGFIFSDAITGEPTCEKKIGDTVKIGRRGSVNFNIEIIGKQGHVAYQELANNPVYVVSKIILALKNYEFDRGNKNFEPTNLEITGMETSTKETGIIPNSIKIMCNVRFNDDHSSSNIIQKVKSIVEQNIGEFSYKIANKVSGESFSLKNDELASQMQEAIFEVTNIKAKLSTAGGTSDARFMKNYANIVEFGMLNATAHKIDEHIEISHITTVTEVYTKFLKKYFNL
ncbi:MAG: succinyl-diaminopimelate desuccinylase [Candidatus Deianiraeaceae bacterium]|jgi:succinyl-diaminopimelate desuccinylase